MDGISQLFVPYYLTIAIYRYNHQYRASLEAAHQDTGQGQMQLAGGTRFPLVLLYNNVALFRDHLALQQWMPTFQTIPGMSLRIIIPGLLVGASVDSDGIICAGNPLQCHEVVEQRSSTLRHSIRYN